MRLTELVVGIVLLIVVVAAIRWQYGRTMREVTDPDQSQYQVLPAATPLTTICSSDLRNCTIPTMGPIFPIR